MKQKRTAGYVMLLSVAFIIVILAGDEALYSQAKTKLGDLAAQPEGHISQRFKPDRSVIYRNLESLVDESALIIVGHITQSRAQLRADGSLNTEHSVQLLQVIKGSPQQNAGMAVVNMPGGVLRFRSGQTIHMYAVDQRTLLSGRTYLFFLSDGVAGAKGYDITGGMQGVYELDGTTGTIIPVDLHKSDPVVRRLSKRSVADALAEVERTVHTKNH